MSSNNITIQKNYLMKPLSEYWFISVPGDGTPNGTWEDLNYSTVVYSDNFKFNIPDLKVGTLDQLIGLSEGLSKLDSTINGITQKLVHHFEDVLEEGKDKLYENLNIEGKDIDTYICKFQWQAAKYPLKQSLKALVDIIMKQVSLINNDMKSKMANYTNLRTALINIDKKSNGSLLTKDLSGIVKPEYFVLNSEYLQTVCVVVPKNLSKEWENDYYKLSDKVVPNSSTLISEDDNYYLYTVTIFKLVLDEFKKNCQIKKFIVRDFVYDEKTLQHGKCDRENLFQEIRKQYPSLVRWLKINFSELFSAHIHVKALSIFVESVLRYGLPVNFQAAILKPKKGCQKKLRNELGRLYHHLDGPGTGSIENLDDQFSLMQLNCNDYYPYVYCDINVDYI
ncbi:V-type proton ATPase subunit C 2 [Strongyloides ratti]|uniref:V-type proton ATPase subunit C n=1 Tax=Strongyloides ratti TaxID=34506 RepID=A0A090LFD9_STRRB|nr:V-type proton ATPase subunit C 2 [Strongyloides ratti]CEF66863.1 V-type proton ATPase subunit C 2 [Strongyloides ratti]